jgi:alkylation response protein AidB-like acyl-CoA dehydrogenase
MNFDWSADQLEFRSTVRSFLGAHLPPDWESIAHGPASESQSAFSKKFCAVSWQPPVCSCRTGRVAGAGAMQMLGRPSFLAEEMWEAGEPRGGQYMNVNWIGPTLMRFGSEEQQERYIPPMARGETIWCQGFSEPEAGSDLASLRTRAEEARHPYRIDGQKIWTSYAGHADTCFILLARTAPGRGGISIFLLPMNTPGITVRQIPSLIGEGDIHEVFFDDVEVSESAMLGALKARPGTSRERTFAGKSRDSALRASAKMLDRAVEKLRKSGRFGTGRLSRQQEPARHAKRRACTVTASLISGAHGIPTGPKPVLRALRR